MLERQLKERGQILVDSKGLAPRVSSVVPIPNLSPISPYPEPPTLFLQQGEKLHPVCIVPTDVVALIPHAP